MAVTYKDIDSLCDMADEMIGSWHPDERDDGHAWVKQMRDEIHAMKRELAATALVREKNRIIKGKQT
jgi:hypothetical protein